MGRNKRAIGYGKASRTRIIRVAPISHAVRLALAASATVFALAGSGAALAQACTDEAADTVYCDGAFTEPVAYEEVEDLTLVLGANMPTSVTAAGEGAGVLVSGSGRLGIDSDADVTVSSPDTAFGLRVFATGSAVVEVRNTGDVAVDADAGAVGIGANGRVVDVANAGSLAATAGDGTAFGIDLDGGNVAVDNRGAIAAESTAGDAVGVSASGKRVDVASTGAISASGAGGAQGVSIWGPFAAVENCGEIAATSDGGIAQGVRLAWENEVAATAINRGSITVVAAGDGASADAFGLHGSPLHEDSVSTGSVSLRNRGGIDVSARGGDATGIFGEIGDGTLDLVNGGAIEAFSAEGDAIGMRATRRAADEAGGGIHVGNSGAIAATSDGLAVDPAGDPVHVGAVGILATAPGDILVTSGGDITVSAPHAHAAGILAAGDDVDARNFGNLDAGGAVSAIGVGAWGVDGALAYNRGAIVVDAADGIGAIAVADGSATSKAIVNNTAIGTVSVSSAEDHAFGLVGLSYDGEVEINNAGDLAATGTSAVDSSGNLQGPGAVYGALGRSAAGGVRIVNRGDIVVDNEYGQAVGIDAASAQGNVRVHNARTGSISAEATGYGSEDLSPDAIGIRATSGARARVTNYGAISALSGFGAAVGVIASGDVAHARNAGTIETYGLGIPASAGISAAAETRAKVENDGSIVVGNVESPLAIGDGNGIEVASHGTAIVDNSGTIEVGALYANGIAAVGDLGVVVSNGGSITPAGWEYASGIVAASSQGDVAVDNSGLVDLAHNVRAGYGIQAFADAGDVSIDNGATGTVYARARTGFGIGVMGVSVAGDVAIDNAGGIEAVNGNYAHQLYAVFGHSDHGDVTVENSGDLAAGNPGAYENWTRGILASSYDGDVLVDNDGTIDVAVDYAGVADGVRATSTAGDIEVDNGGAIVVQSTGYASGYAPPYAFGVSADTDADDGAVLVTNTGSIDVGAEDGFAVGIHADGVPAVVSSPPSYTGASEVLVHNAATGTIDVAGYFDATGIQAAGDIVAVDNAGLIDAVGSLAIYGPSTSTFGVIATGQTLASVGNTGRIEATDTIRAIAIYADTDTASTGPGAIARVSNAGDVIATSLSTYGVAAGIAAFSAGGVELTNTGSIQSTGARPFGIYAEGDDLDIVNADTIAAIGANSEYHYGSVVGILARAPVGGAGTVEITTLEGSSITAESLPFAVGILAGGGDTIRIDNAGDISAVDDFDPDAIDSGFGGSYGIRAGASVQLDIDNSGEITVDVTVGGAMGISAEGSSIDIVNDGALDIYSDGVRRSINPTEVYGIRAYSGQDATVVNNGDIDAGNGFGSTFGIFARAAGDAVVRNDGTITVTGGEALYYAESFGIHVRSPDGGIRIDNTGQIAVTAPGTGNYGGTDAIGIFADGGEVMVTNTGSITAYSLHSPGTSVGVATQGDVLTVVNHGDILASTVTADPYAAIGVQMDATTSATFNNTGTITTVTADGVGSGVAVLIESDGAIDFSNTGTLLGAVVTRGGDDAFTGQAGSLWTLAHRTTDLGAGDDRIRNLFGSTLELDSGRIVLGGGRNSFANHGLIRVRGDSLVDMGDARFGMALVNDGVIELGGGAADRLTVAGDLGGRGVIRVGRGNDAAGGRLRVDGSVRPGSVQTVDVDFAGFDALRRRAGTDFAFVRGDSTAGSFVGGRVLGFEPGNFLRLGVAVDSRIDAGNRRDDVFSASVRAEGLDDSGRLAASLGAGAQSLLAAQIGTWRQRSGAIPGQSPERTMTGFVRSFGNEGGLGTLDAGSGQRGDFGFGQQNAGAEMGMQYQPAAGFSLGMRIGKSEGQQTLTGAGRGLNWIRADTIGMYGTWVSTEGLYVDASAWRMNFDSRMQSTGSRHATRGEASAINLEAGLAFEMPGGLRLEPSLQYTWTRIGGLALQGSQAEFRSEAGDWRRARAGMLVWKPIRGGSGTTWTPYGSISVVRTDASGASYTVSDVFNGGTSADGTSALLELGLGLHRRGFSANAGLNWTSGDAVGNVLGGQVLLRYGW